MDPWSAMLVLFASAAADARPQVSCEQGDNMAAVRACIYQQHDQEMRAKFERVRQAIAMQSETAARRLDDAQSRWHEFMDASCDYSALAAPESMYPQDARTDCIVAFTKARTRILDGYQREFRKLPISGR